MDLELWKYVDNYEDRYAVSTHGRVKSFYYPAGNSAEKRKIPYIMKQGKGSKRSNYFKVSLHKDWKRKTTDVHVLEGRAFLDPRKRKETIDHIDGNTYNNHISNLRYATRSEQARNRKSWSNTNIQGVYWLEKSQRYRAGIHLLKKEGEKKSKLITKSFSVKNHGTKENALALAIEWRREKEKEICPEFYNMT